MKDHVTERMHINDYELNKGKEKGALSVFGTHLLCADSKRDPSCDLQQVSHTRVRLRPLNSTGIVVAAAAAVKEPRVAIATTVANGNRM